MNIDIDSGSGFCYGVVRAIRTAEKFLETSDVLYSLGAIVHNESELERLAAEGLTTIDYDTFRKGVAPRDILIRAHGEPPATYRMAAEMGYRITDCTCPVVLKLQQRIHAAAVSMKGDGNIFIFGKIGHAEVNGLVGQTEDSGCCVNVIENMDMLRKILGSGEIRKELRTEVFAQTTKDPGQYQEICEEIKRHCPETVVHNTICAQVSSRHEGLRNFSMAHDVIVFVAGKESSNGKVLYDLCRGCNARTYFTTGPEDIEKDWFKDEDNVGVCGATSTPKWLLEKVADAIRNING